MASGAIIAARQTIWIELPREPSNPHTDGDPIVQWDKRNQR